MRRRKQRGYLIRRIHVKTSYAIAGISALAVLTVASSADADDQRWPMWYIGITGGYSYMGDQDVDSATASKVSAGNGFGVGGSIGYLPNSSLPLLNALRFEIEVTYHQNDINTVHFHNGTSTGGSGTYDSTAYMANVFYDIPTGTKWSPYIGGGIGMATLHIPLANRVGTDDSDDEFAYQGMAGIGYSPDSIPNTVWSIGYRYLGTDDADLGNAKVKYSTSNVEAGVRFRF